MSKFDALSNAAASARILGKAARQKMAIALYVQQRNGELHPSHITEIRELSAKAARAGRMLLVLSGSWE